MGLNDTPLADRVHIGLFGRRNAGKSSLINALTGQEVAIVSAVAGTTTDPVSKAMELLPLGPVVFVDTPGLDDDSELGEKRVRKSLQALEKIDIALLVVDAGQGRGPLEEELEESFRARDIPCLVVLNKTDLLEDTPRPGAGEIVVSAYTGENIGPLRERIARLRPAENPRWLVGDLLAPGEVVVLVVPIDSAAPKGRLILPQQQTIRDILAADAQAIITKESGLERTLAHLATPPRLVVTDSQVFGPVAKQLPAEIPLTSFSILFARYKGILAPAVEALRALDSLEDGDRVLISEGCSHHRQCEDIGTVKMPKWIAAHSGRDIEFAFSAGGEFPEDLSGHRLVVHCGGCMLQDRAMKHRLAMAQKQQVPMTNYGIAIAHMNGILPRTLGPFPEFAGQGAE